MDKQGRSATIQARPVIEYSVRTLATLCIAALFAVVLPTAGEAQFRGGGFHPGGFGHFHPRPWQPREPIPSGFPRGPPSPRGPRDGGPYGAYGPNAPPPIERDQQDMARQFVNQGRYARLDTVIGNIQRQTPGRQLNSDLDTENGIYRVRWMTNQGRRIDYVVDAATGRILGER
jgi:hypothetical protein